ncbi:MAG: single-stranded DNA-binding protein [Salinivirgaceae bacterium]|nr:single-stranded DNA-binding protein [Salinivirgaceae bacterium]
MMINKVILVGNVGGDPDVRTLENNVKVATVSLATSERYTDSNKQKQERTTWHRVVLWRNLAEVVEKYVHKGSQLYIEGRISNRQYKDKDGNDRYAMEIVANDMKLLGKRDDNSGTTNHNTDVSPIGTVPPPSVDEMPADDLPF